MKSFYKKTVIAFSLLLLAGTFVNTEKAYASEFNASVRQSYYFILYI